MAAKVSPLWYRGGLRDQLLVEETEKIREVALEYPEWSPREVGVHLADACGFTASESTVYRILKQAGWVMTCPP